MGIDDLGGWQPPNDIDAATGIAQLEPERRSRLAETLAGDHRWQMLISEHRARVAANAVGGAAQARLLDSGQSSQAWEVVKGDSRLVVRVPIPNSGRRMSYRSEALLGQLLAGRGHPVATWDIKPVDNVECSVGSLLPGAPVAYATSWSSRFVDALAGVLRDLHGLETSGWGPLQNRSDSLVGMSGSSASGVIDRWFHAPVWPFRDVQLESHPVAGLGPDAIAAISALREPILAAADGPFGVVHSDLHRQHLLVDGDELTGVLDFGDAFIGSIAWDFGLVRWYYGPLNTSRLAAAYKPASDLADRGALLAVAVGCYKMARSPHNKSLGPQLLSLLADLDAHD